MHAQLAAPAAPPRAHQKSPRIVINGGGVGGLASAVALYARGFTDVTVLEREGSQSAAARSTGLALWPNALRSLALIAPSLQLDKRVEAAGVVLRETRFSFDGTNIASSTSVESYRPDYGYPAVTLRWRALTGALSDALPLDCIRYGAAMARYEVQPDGSVTAVLSDGSEQHCDILVGADGLRSTTRAQIFGNADPSPLRDTGRVAWRAVVPTNAALLGTLPYGEAWMAASPKPGTCTLMHMNASELYWATGSLPDAVIDDPPSEDPDPVARRAMATFAAWPRVLEVMRATPAHSILQQRLFDRAPLPPDALSSAGPVTLVGDSLHAMVPSLGQGACSALEGALELAQCLGAAMPENGGNGDFVSSLRRYAEERLKRVGAIQSFSSTAGEDSYASREERERRKIFRVDKTPLEFNAWLFDYRSPHPDVV